MFRENLPTFTFKDFPLFLGGVVCVCATMCKIQQRKTKHHDFTLKLSPHTHTHTSDCDRAVQTKGKATLLHKQLKQQLPDLQHPEGQR